MSTEPSTKWTTEQINNLKLLGVYHQDMVSTLENVWKNGPSVVKNIPTAPQLSLQDILQQKDTDCGEEPPPKRLRFSPERKESLMQLSEYLKEKIFEVERGDVGWRPDPMCEDIDELIKHVKEGK